MRRSNSKAACICYNIMMNGEEQSIGMMEGAFFVPKTDLINWVNSTLALEVTKIEQLGTGAVYCAIIDAMYPGKVTMQRVNWRARNEWEFINNYKILQQAFAKCKIQKYIDIEKLSKSRYQDNLEFVQWLKRYFDLHNKNDLSSYDAVAARKGAEVDFSFVEVRNPLKNRQKDKDNKDSSKNLRKSKSPYDNVKPKINNRSVTLGKPKKESQFFMQKLSKIRQILKQGKKESDKLNKIQQIMQEIEEQLPPANESQVIQNPKMQKAQSKKIIEVPKRQRQKIGKH